MIRSALWLLAATLLLHAAPAGAADVSIAELLAPPPPPAVAAPPVTGPVLPPPRVRFGCQRVWRCDAQVCEWRRGCRGVYGYVETPYYTSAFARRQWEAHGLPPGLYGHPRRYNK